MSSPIRRLAIRVLPDPVVRAIRARRARLRPAGPRAPRPTAKHETISELVTPPTILARVATGERLDDAVVSGVRDLLESGDVAPAMSAGESLRRHRDTHELGSLVLAIAAFDRGFRELAWKHLGQVSSFAWSRWAVREFALAGAAVDRPEVVEQLSKLAAEPAGQVTPEGWGEAAGFAFGLRESELARSLFKRFSTAVDAADQAELGPRTTTTRDWLRRWIDLTPDSPSAGPVPEGHVSFAVMGYDHPGRSRASANIGDHVQSVASLGHLVRHTGVRFHGDYALVSLLNRLADHVQDGLRVADPPADVDVITVDRDASAYDAIPPRTWTLAFGWFMHAIFELSYGLPLHRNLLPLYVSFHCNRRDLLTPEVIDHLREFGPVGCRDWTTADLLISMGVPAFFSGCLTTTVSTVFPPPQDRPGPDAPVAYIDVPDAPPGADVYEHSDDAIRFRSFTDNVGAAVDLLETYRSRHSAVVTSRLHAYLPCRSLGLDVDFRPKNRSDLRFEGLGDISDQQFDAIRTGLLDVLAPVISAILRGEEPDAVYERWREATAPAVQAAERRHNAPSTIPRFSLDRSVLQSAVDGTTVSEPADHVPSSGDPVEVVVHTGGQGSDSLRVGFATLVRSLRRSTTRPLTVTLLTRAPDRIDLAYWSDRFPDIRFRVVPTAGIADSLRTPLGKAPRARDLDVVLLPDLLPEVDRVVLLPPDAVATADIAELHDLDLDGFLFAAPTTVGKRGSSGFGVLHAAAAKLGDHTEAAAELRRFAHGRHVFDFDGCTSSVLVLDLAQMRERGFVADQLDRIAAFGLSLTALLCLEAGPDRAIVPETWAAAPTRSPIDDPKLVHWVDSPKPWEEWCVPAQEVWWAAAFADAPTGHPSGE